METKIPFYNIVNMLLTGLIFLGFIVFLFPVQLSFIFNNPIITNLSVGSQTIFTVSVLAVVYECGLIINRIGSVILEPLLKGLHLVPYNNDYLRFNLKKQQFPILGTLSREYALSRTGIVLFLILSILSLINKKWLIAFIFLIIALIYYLSCRKHAQKIVDLMKE